MAKPEPHLLDPARYPVSFPLATRYQDLDPNNHINNVSIAALFEDVRVRFDRAAGLKEAIDRDRQGVMIASLGIEYLDELFYPDLVMAHVGALQLGRTSWTLGGLLTQGGRAAAFMRATMVWLGDGKPAPMAALFRESLERNLIRPGAAAHP